MSDRFEWIKANYATYPGLAQFDIEWLVTQLTAERTLSEMLVDAIHTGCHVDVLGEDKVYAAFALHRQLRDIPEDAVWTENGWRE